MLGLPPDLRVTARDPARELAGWLGVEASARLVRHYRYAEERLMRTMAGWIALTPELPAKLLLGRQVWECAQHADLWGKRLPELRAPAQVSEPPSAAFARLMDALENREAWGETVERLTGVYRVLKPHLAEVYSRHLERANPVYEPRPGESSSAVWQRSAGTSPKASECWRPWPTPTPAASWRGMRACGPIWRRARRSSPRI